VFRLERFVEAQNPVYRQVCDELRQGHKRSHWIWFIFPQIRGLGSSPTAIEFAISGREEAAAYLAHATLGPRLAECTSLVAQVEGRSIGEIFPYPDDLKFRSSMTLFAEVASDGRIFREALTKYFAGKADPATLALL
jgi:uncharacterized protein (DUF1810 family)